MDWRTGKKLLLSLFKSKRAIKSQHMHYMTQTGQGAPTARGTKRDFGKVNQVTRGSNPLASDLCHISL